MLHSNAQVAMSGEKHTRGRKTTPPVGVKSGDQRRFKRVSVLWSGEYSDAEGAEQRCVIYDISVNGVRAKVDHALEIGSKLVIKIAGGIQLISEVVWAKGETVGLCFKDNPQKLASIMAGILPMECLEQYA